MTTLRIMGLALLGSVLVLAHSGCSFSYSSKSVSDSVGSFSESSSPSEGIGKDKIPYRDDIATLTSSIAGTSLSAGEFPVALARVARQHKITDWAREKASFYGIGKGLKQAGIPKDKIQAQPFLAEVLAANPDALKWIKAGY